MTDNGNKTKLYLENDFCIINKKEIFIILTKKIIYT